MVGALSTPTINPGEPAVLEGWGLYPPRLRSNGRWSSAIGATRPYGQPCPTQQPSSVPVVDDEKSGAWFKIKGNGVHAVALPGGGGAVVEDVAKVGTAGSTQHFGTTHQ